MSREEQLNRAFLDGAPVICGIQFQPISASRWALLRMMFEDDGLKISSIVAAYICSAPMSEISAIADDRAKLTAKALILGDQISMVGMRQFSDWFDTEIARIRAAETEPVPGKLDEGAETHPES